jgi:hypothetical protein
VSKTISCYSYSNDLGLVNDLRGLINNGYTDLFIAVVVHGSIATDEICAYSDFDGLLIVKDEYKGSKLLKSFLKKSVKIISKFDPLQHHGWFTIYKSQLKNYPQTYFPNELFAFSKLIFPQSKVNFSIEIVEDINYSKPFYLLANNIQKKLKNGCRPKGMFQLKSFLSEMMLLPTFFYKAKNREGIFKKHSFEIVKPLISQRSWQAITVCSVIRENWQYRFVTPKSLFIITKNNRFLRRISRVYLAPPISQEIKSLLTESFYNTCLACIDEMKQKLHES